MIRLSERRGSGGEASARSATTGHTLMLSRSTISCDSGGDLVSLVELWGPFSVPEAVAWLGHTYNLDLPERPESWFKKQTRQERLREQLRKERHELLRRRLFKYFILPQLEKVPKPDRARETEAAWERFKRIPIPYRGADG